MPTNQGAAAQVGRRVQYLVKIENEFCHLATTDELAKACCTVHFAEQFIDQDGQRKMTFDYQMRQGIAETTNALKLLEMVGLGE